MENAAKALTIAGTILISLIVISALIFMFREIRGIKSQDASNQKTQQIIDFNKSYESYDKTLYGSELLSLASKIEDYNVRYTAADGYQPIKLIINSGINNTDISNFNSNDASSSLTSYRDTIENLMKNIYKSSNNLEALNDCIEKMEENENEKTSDVYTRAYYQKGQILNKIGKTSLNDDTIKSDYEKYKKYQELKTGKKFKCKGIEYDNGNGRIISMTFSQT